MPETFQVPARWQSRFAFYNAYGLPGSTPQAREAFKALSFGARMRLNGNVPAFLFGPIYFFVKGMWRKGITLLIAGLSVGVVLFFANVSDDISRAVGTGLAAAAMLCANYAYYLHVTRHSESWNPFEGYRRKSQSS